MQKYDVVLLEVQGETGLKRSEIMSLLDKINGDEVYPLEILSDVVESCALGFITPKAANTLDFDYAESGLTDFIKSIIDDINNETKNCEYSFKELTIFMSRNVQEEVKYMEFPITLNEKEIQSAVISECVRYVKEKQMSQMLNEIAKQVAQEIKGEVVDSGLVEKRVEEVVKRVENSLMTRVNRQFTVTMDEALSATATTFEAPPPMERSAKAMRDHFIATLIGFQNETGCNVESDEYKAYQKMLDWVETNYGQLMS